MNQRKLSEVLLGVGGIFLLVVQCMSALVDGASLLQLKRQPDDAALSASAAAALHLGLDVSVAGMILGGCFLLFRKKISRRLFPDDALPLTSEGLHSIGLSLLGCFLVAQALPRAALAGTDKWRWIVQTILGVALFLGGRGLSGAWSALRGVGRVSG